MKGFATEHPRTLSVTAQITKQGDHLLLCEADVEQEGRTLVHAIGTFAVLAR
jgi:acyl-coenzyme A thioesterase PaaI-like protein